MALFNQILASIARQIQAFYTIPLWEKADGTGINAQADDDGNLYVAVDAVAPGMVVGVEGIIADNAPNAGVLPVVVGGVHYSDPTLVPLADGDVGYALLTDQRRLAIEDRVYDAPTDANREVPVWSVPDKAFYETLDSTLGADGTVSKYISMRGFLRWSIHYVPTAAAAEVITLTVFQSNDDVDDPTTATYRDVTNTFFGVAGFVAAAWIEPWDPTSCRWLKVVVTVTSWTAGTSAWKAQLSKLAQA